MILLSSYANTNSPQIQTSKIQTAIDYASSNGEILYIPKGKYISGGLNLPSNTHIVFDCSAILQASCDIKDYPQNRGENAYKNETHLDRCFIYSENAENIIIEGYGEICGQGEKFTVWNQERPMMFRFVKCKNIKFSDMRFSSPASWTMHFSHCNYINIFDCDFFSPNIKNGDGTDFDGCSDVFISNCRYDTGDDSICLQASKTDSVCERITITNCVCRSKWAMMRIGASCRGTIKEVVVSNCVIREANCSAFKIQTGEGGSISDISVNHIIMRDVPRPIFITNNRFPFTKDTPNADEIPCSSVINKLTFSDFTASYSTNSYIPDTGIIIFGSPELEISNIYIKDIKYFLSGGGFLPQEEIKSLEHNRPEFTCFHEKLPSYALYARYVKDLNIQDFYIYSKKDVRCAVFIKDCENALTKNIIENQTE